MRVWRSGQATANNLITVAERYTSENPALTELIGDLEYTVRLAQNSYDDFAEEGPGQPDDGPTPPRPCMTS